MSRSEYLSLRLQCRNCHVRGSALCRAVAETGLQGVHSARSREVPRDTTLAFEGDIPQFLGVLRRGFLRKVTARQNGQRTILGLACPGDLIGGVLRQPLDFALEAATDAEICVFDKQTVDRMIRQDLSFKRCIMEEASAQHHQQLELIWRRGALNSRERIMAFLMMAAGIMPSESAPDGGLVVRIDLSRRDWADLSNTTVETISRTMRELADQGLVSRLKSGRYKIHALNRLAVLAGIDGQESDRTAAKRTSPMTAINAAAPERLQTRGVLVTGP